jgi:anaerobic glycerol-3-phosphate dehydrogenase C subunit
MQPGSRSLIKKLSRAFREKIRGEFRFDSQSRLQYSTAACMYRISPLGVVMPRDGDDVSSICRIARDFNVPVTARGAGVGRTGSALGSGLVMDFSRHMNRILSIDSENKRVRVEPGVIQNDLDRALMRFNLFFPPDPSSNRYCTIGGMIGNNAGGAHSVKYGATKDYLSRISVVLDDGEETLFTRDMTSNGNGNSRVDQLVHGVRKIVDTHRDSLNRYLPRTSKNSSGYLLDMVRPDNDGTDLVSILAASEGTLGLFTEIELNVETKPACTGLILFFFESIEAAGEAVIISNKYQPSMLEIMEDTFVNLVRKSAFEIGIPFPQDLKAMLLVEFDGTCVEEVQEKLELLERELVGPGRQAMSARRGLDQSEKDRLTRVRDAASPILNRIPPPLYPARFIEDGTVPIENLPAYINGLHRILGKYDVSGVIFGHAGNGNIHVNPFMDVTKSDFRRKLEDIFRDTTLLIKSLNGSLSGEHGDGLIRSPVLPEMFGPAFQAFEELKKLFDPDGLLNPGIIVGGERYRLSDNLKVFDMYSSAGSGTAMDNPVVVDNMIHCSGCGACRAYCPVFIATRDEMATPRAKANLLTWLVSNNAVETLGGIGPEEKSILDLCINCGTCLNECPSGVNIPYVVQTAKWVHHEEWGVSLADRLITSTKLLGYAGNLKNQFTSRAMSSPWVRKLIEKIIGIDRRQGLPEFINAPNRYRSDEYTNSQRHHQIAYFPGCFAEFNDPNGEQFPIVYLLKHHDISPLIPNTECCGIAKLSSGLRGGVVDDARQNVDTLFDLVSKGFRVVTGSPSCGMAIRHEYPQLLQTEESRTVADNMFDIHEFLADLMAQGLLDLNFSPLPYRIAVHQPCHARAMNIGELPLKLLKLIPGLDIHALEPKCCGIAGTFGMKNRNYDVAQSIGKPLFTAIQSINPDYIVTPCGTCRIQLQQATSIPAIHPAGLLARAYGYIADQYELTLQYGSRKD